MAVATAPRLLTPRQAEVFGYIYAHCRRHGFPPSYGDLSLRFGMAHRSGVHSAVIALACKGWLVLPGVRRRGFHFLRRPDGTPFEGFADDPPLREEG
jgi:SOS-response transcriptional repressor LexA